MTENKQEPQLNQLLGYYWYIIGNIDLLSKLGVFNANEKTTLEFYDSNHSKLVSIRDKIIVKDFVEAFTLLSNHKFPNNQKSIVTNIINHYSENQDIDYDSSYGLDKMVAVNLLTVTAPADVAIVKTTEPVLTRAELEANNKKLVDSIIELNKKLFDNISELPESVSKKTEIVDYSKIEVLLKANLPSGYNQIPFEPFEKKLYECINEIVNESVKLRVSLSQAANSYESHEKISKTILENTVKNVTSAQNKIYDEIQDTVARVNLIELKAFFNDVSNVVKVIKEEGAKQANKLSNVAYVWLICFMVMFTSTVVLSSYFTSNRTVKLFLNLAHQGSNR